MQHKQSEKQQLFKTKRKIFSGRETEEKKKTQQRCIFEGKKQHTFASYEEKQFKNNNTRDEDDET